MQIIVDYVCTRFTYMYTRGGDPNCFDKDRNCTAVDGYRHLRSFASRRARFHDFTVSRFSLFSRADTSPAVASTGLCWLTTRAAYAARLYEYILLQTIIVSIPLLHAQTVRTYTTYYSTGRRGGLESGRRVVVVGVTLLLFYFYRRTFVFQRVSYAIAAAIDIVYVVVRRYVYDI